MGRIATALAALALAAQAGAQTLTLGTKLELNTLDPHFFNGFPPGSSHRMIYDSLAYQTETLDIVPQLATGWRLVDATTWEFDLKPGVRFHDGTPFGPEDVIATVRRVPAVPNSPALFSVFTRSIKAIEAIGPHRIRVTTSAPNPTLPADLARVFIVPARFEQASTAQFNDRSAAIGTGPYRVVDWTNGDRLVLARHEAWHGGTPTWERVTERVITRDPSRVAALLAGEVDAIDIVPLADKPRLAGDSRFALFSGPAAVVHYIALDSVRAESPHATQPNPLRDVRVRRALSLAIDRGAITERLMEGSAEPASQFLPASIDGTSQRLQPDPFDPGRARALLAEAGFPQGFRLTLHTTTDRYQKDAAIAQAIGQMWTRIGIQAQVEGVPGQIFFGAATRQEYSAFIAQYGTSEALEGPRAVLHTNEAGRGFGAANRTRYSNAKVDQLVQAAAVEMDPEKRRDLTQQAIEAGFADVGIIPIFHPTWDYAARAGLRITPNPQRRFNALMVQPAR